MTNRQERRRQARRTGRRPSAPKIHFAEFVDPAVAAHRLAGCSCDYTIQSAGGLITIEHWHAPGCPQLAELKRTGGVG